MRLEEAMSALEKAAVAAARRIGKVEVDHGETGCQTPDAADHIRKALARKGYLLAPAAGGRKRRRQ